MLLLQKIHSRLCYPNGTGFLHELTKKKVKFQWTLKEDNAFDAMKEKLMTKPLLSIPDLKKPFEVQCDTCGESLGAFLLQESHPIAYESRQLKYHEQVY